MEQAILLVQCPDQKGIVAKLSSFVLAHDANIISSYQYSTDPDGGRFFMRVKFVFDEDRYSRQTIEEGIQKLADGLDARWRIHYESRVMRMAIAVSRLDHCLADLLYRVHSGELRVEIPLVVSNHEDAREQVENHGIPFHYLPVTKETRPEQEKRFLELIQDSSDFLVLARYMQVLSEDFLNGYGKDVINIHHSFLPSFAGANPYRQAYDRGVKIIGATAHFATTALDEGPIIDQAVGRVTHKDKVESLKAKGRDLEKQALASAIRMYLEHRVIRDENKTIILG